MAKRPKSMQITLSDDLVFDILCRLPIESILKFKSVCKSWNCMTQDPVFINCQVSWSKVHPPKLLFNANASCFLTETSDFNAKKLMDINDIKKPIVKCSFNGLICIAPGNHLDPLKICNPITRESLELPRSHFIYDRAIHQQVALGYDNITKRYTVVRSFVLSYENICRRASIEMLTLGETAWKKIRTRETYVDDICVGPVFHDGAFYWISVQNQLLQLDLSTHKLLYFPQQILTPLTPLCHCIRLLNLEGRLLLTGESSRSFFVFEVNNRSRHYFTNFMKDHLRSNDTTVDISGYTPTDLICMPSQDNYIMRLTRTKVDYIEWKPVNIFVSYHAQNNTVACFYSGDLNVMSFKPSLLFPNMTMSSRTGNYNYGAIGEALKVDLPNRPENLEQNATLAFQAAIWTWMTPIKKSQPSAHEAFIGLWKPTKNDTMAKRVPGFGATMKILYGDYFCGKGDIDPMNNIISHYLFYCDLLGIGREQAGPNEVLSCAEQVPFNPTSATRSASSS
ncbi:hypothetical protein L6164_013515 [Bauhinia variegata]|uniref:Uncharacterized protein n=1 Tax=Bauhinia variegata TaxID=167791 RepID=A0ACB9NF67_BAUVA|nr:hypothetical protein L6164_013515 [Bauhinia variegata]